MHISSNYIPVIAKKLIAMELIIEAERFKFKTLHIIWLMKEAHTPPTHFAYILHNLSLENGAAEKYNNKSV